MGINLLKFIFVLLKKTLKSLLPKEIFDRVAQSKSLPNIKPRFKLEGLKRLKIFLFSLFLLNFAATPFSLMEESAYAFDSQKNTVTEQIQTEQLPILSLPHPGYLSTKFSNYHPGIDIATGFGMPVHPVAAGIIEEVNLGFLGLGNNAVISHSNNFKSTYGHMGRVYVKKGDEVNLNTTLGTVGMSGFTTGPHTHLEIEVMGKKIDTETILPKLDEYPKEEFLKPFTKDSKEMKISTNLKPEFN